MQICLLYTDNTLDSAKFTLQQCNHDFPLADSFSNRHTTAYTACGLLLKTATWEPENGWKDIKQTMFLVSSVTGQGLDMGQGRGGVVWKRQKPVFFLFSYFFFCCKSVGKQVGPRWTAVSFLVFLLFLWHTLSRWGLVSSEYKSPDWKTESLVACTAIWQLWKTCSKTKA